jgi:hypothetical protein
MRKYLRLHGIGPLHDNEGLYLERPSPYGVDGDQIIARAVSPREVRIVRIRAPRCAALSRLPPPQSHSHRSEQEHPEGDEAPLGEGGDGLGGWRFHWRMEFLPIAGSRQASSSSVLMILGAGGAEIRERTLKRHVDSVGVMLLEERQ